MDVSTHHRFWRSDFEINKNKNYAIWKMADKNCMQRAKLELCKRISDLMS